MEKPKLKPMLDETLKRNIRESLVYAVHASTPKKWKWLRRIIIDDFYHSLNRKAILYNYETEEEISKAIQQLENLENPT